MKLIVAVVQGIDGDLVAEALSARGFEATQIDSAGGFLRERNATLMVGVPEAHVAEAMQIIRENCSSRTQYVNPLMPILEPGDHFLASPVEVIIGGATLFVLRVSRYERIG